MVVHCGSAFLLINMASSGNDKKTKRSFWKRLKAKGPQLKALIRETDTRAGPTVASHSSRLESDDPEGSMLSIHSNAAEEVIGVFSPLTIQSNVVEEGLGLAGRFVQTLLKKLPDCVDNNPVKMALSIVKTIIEIKDVRVMFTIHSRLFTQ